MNGRGTRTARSMRLVRISLALLLAGVASGCVTVAEHRKLERRVNELKADAGSMNPNSVADLRTELSALRQQLETVEGRLQVAEHEARTALGEAQSARREAAGGGYVPGPPGPPPTSGPPGASGPPPLEASAEVAAYREAYEAWRNDETELCIDRFGRFLQTHRSSVYADDSAYWLADCYYKQGDYRNAVLRYDDVVRTYPTSEKAAEALYRQGEALLRLNRGKAAQTAFERVLSEYPDSVSAGQAKRQLELLGG